MELFRAEAASRSQREKKNVLQDRGRGCIEIRIFPCWSARGTSSKLQRLLPPPPLFWPRMPFETAVVTRVAAPGNHYPGRPDCRRCIELRVRLGLSAAPRPVRRTKLHDLLLAPSRNCLLRRPRIAKIPQRCASKYIFIDAESQDAACKMFKATVASPAAK